MPDKYDKLPQHIAELARERDKAPESQRSFYNKKILALFNAQYGTELSAFSEETKHVRIHNDYAESMEKKALLAEQHVIERPKRLRNETRKEEITDTTLVSYLQQMFVSDSGDYMIWNTDRLYDVRNPLVSVPWYIEEQKAIIDAMPFDLSMLSNTELQTMFSQLTDHVWEPVDENDYLGNAPKYRNEAVFHIDQLKEVFKTAKPIILGGRDPSWKILYVTTWPGKWKVIEFRYNKFYNSDRKHDKTVRVNIYDSWVDCKKKINEDQKKITFKKQELTSIYNKYMDFYQHNETKSNKEVWKETLEELQNELNEFYGAYVGEVVDAIERTEKNEKYMYWPQYTLSMYGILNNIRSAIDEMDAVSKRYLEYANAKK